MNWWYLIYYYNYFYYNNSCYVAGTTTLIFDSSLSDFGVQEDKLDDTININSNETVMPNITMENGDGWEIDLNLSPNTGISYRT